MPTQEWTGTTNTTFTVPDGVDEVQITCDGQDGETNNFDNYTTVGGSGGTASATLPAAGGTTLYIKIDTGVVAGGIGGESDGVSADGGKGGGGAFVGTSNSIGDAVCIAGGGGGAAGMDETFETKDGNDGGGPNYDGGNSSFDGSQTSGGEGGSGTYDGPGEDGGHGQGGDGGQNLSGDINGGGGGGGGWYGGGGGAAGTSLAQGGGGASGYASGATTNVSGAVGGSNNSSGRVFLSYTVPLDTPTVSVTSHNATSISLSWGSVDYAESYQIFRSDSPGVTTGDTKVYDGTGTSYTDSGLPDATTYYYRVQATDDSDGTVSDLSNEAAQQTDLRATTPTLDATTEDEITLTWSRADANAGGDFEVYRSESDGTLGTRIADGLSPTATAYTDTGLEDGERYHYTLRRVVNGLTADGTQQAATTILPAPTGLSLDASTDGEVALSWVVNDDSPDGNVEVYRSADGSLGTVVATLGNDATSYTDTGLLDGERYHYTVRRSTDHTSADTAQQAATTVLPAPTDLSATTTATSATLTWTDNANNGTIRVETRRSSDPSYTTEASGIELNTETYDLTGLLTGEEYDARVIAVTEHAETIDS